MLLAPALMDDIKDNHFGEWLCQVKLSDYSCGVACFPVCKQLTKDVKWNVTLVDISLINKKKKTNKRSCKTHLTIPDHFKMFRYTN